MGISKELYLSLFPSIPSRPQKGHVIEGHYDFQKTDTLLPHPVYAWMGWVCVLNPSHETFEQCRPLLENAYTKAKHLTYSKISKNKNSPPIY